MPAGHHQRIHTAHTLTGDKLRRARQTGQGPTCCLPCLRWRLPDKRACGLLCRDLRAAFSDAGPPPSRHRGRKPDRACARLSAVSNGLAMSASTVRRMAPFPEDTTGMIPAIGEGGLLFPIDKMKAHEIGQLHLAISVFLFAGDRMLIQQRALEKYHCGGQWANACCSHPHWGEEIAACAPRRLEEELGVIVPLEEVGVLTYKADVGGGLTEHERVHLFHGHVDPTRLMLDPDPNEVADTRWVGIDDLQAEIAAQPEDFTPWFRLYLTRWADLTLPGA